MTSVTLLGALLALGIAIVLIIKGVESYDLGLWLSKILVFWKKGLYEKETSGSNAVHSRRGRH